MTSNSKEGSMSEKELILKHISKHDGEWGWYQLDRALSVKQIHLGQELLAVLSGLEEEGLISGSGDDPGHPKYRLTEAGREFVGRLDA